MPTILVLGVLVLSRVRLLSQKKAEVWGPVAAPLVSHSQSPEGELQHHLKLVGHTYNLSLLEVEAGESEGSGSPAG